MKKIAFIFIISVSMLSGFKITGTPVLKNDIGTNCLVDTTGKQTITKTKGYTLKTRDLTFSRIETYVDSGYYPRSLYYNIRLAEVLGVSLREVTAGKLQVSVLNEKDSEVQLPKEYSFYAAKTFKEGDKINILIIIPLAPSDANNKKYNYKILFETGTGKQIIEMTGKIGYK